MRRRRLVNFGSRWTAWAPERAARLLQPDVDAVALVLEFLEAVLVHEVEQALDFRQIDAARLPRRTLLSDFAFFAI